MAGFAIDNVHCTLPCKYNIILSHFISLHIIIIKLTNLIHIGPAVPEPHGFKKVDTDRTHKRMDQFYKLSRQK